MSRLISIIVILALFLAFIVLNIDNKCDISFGFKTFREIPVFVSVLFSFVLGIVFSLPFGIALSRKLKKNTKTEPPVAKKKRWGKDKSKDTAESAPAPLEEVHKDNSPYGID